MFLGKHSLALPPLIFSLNVQTRSSHREPINPSWRNCSKNTVEIDFALLLMNLFQFVLNTNKNVDITLSSFVIMYGKVSTHR